MRILAKANLVFTAPDQKQLTDEAIAVCHSVGIDKSELLAKTIENFSQAGKVTAKDAARQLKIFEKHRQTKIALVVMTLRDKQKGSPSGKFMSTLSDLSMTVEDRIIRKHNLSPEMSTSQTVFDPHAIEKIDFTKNKWMSVCRKKEQLTTYFTQTQKQKLGDTFSKEREANRRLKEDKEIREHQANEKNTKWKEVLSRKQQIDKKLIVKMKALESENKQKLEESASRRNQMVSTQIFSTQPPDEHKSTGNNSFRMTQFQFVDRGKLDREQSFQDFAQATQILSNKESQIEMARVQREQEILLKKEHLKNQVERKEQTHEYAKQKEHEESEETYKNVLQRRYEIAQQISRAQQEHQEIIQFKKDKNQQRLLEAKQKAHQIRKEVDSNNRAKFRLNLKDQIQLDPYSDKPLGTILEKENDIRIEMNEERREAVRQNLQRRRDIMQQYKQQLIQDVINKKNRCASLGRQREEIVNHSMENNRSIRQEFIQVQVNWKQSTKPVPFETHYATYDKERRRLAKMQAEGEKK